MKQFKKVTFDFMDENIIILKEAMEITTKETCKKNTSINFIKNGFEITEEIDERFFFSFARNYGKLLKS